MHVLTSHVHLGVIKFWQNLVLTKQKSSGGLAGYTDDVNNLFWNSHHWHILTSCVTDFVMYVQTHSREIWCYAAQSTWLWHIIANIITGAHISKLYITSIAIGIIATSDTSQAIKFLLQVSHCRAKCLVVSSIEL